MLKQAIRTLVLCAAAMTFAVGGVGAQEETAWDSLLRDDPALAEEGATQRLERQILQRLTPDQAERFAAGEVPSTIILADGQDLGKAIEEGFGAAGGVYFPVDSCKLTGVGVPGDDRYPVGDTVITARGTCDVPPQAVGLIVNLKVHSQARRGRVSVFPAGGGQFSAGVIDTTAGSTGMVYNNTVIVELCQGVCESGDLVVRILDTFTNGTGTRITLHVVGYLAPGADADPTNELNSSVALVGTQLQVTDVGGTLSADLGSLMADADADPTNELNSSVALVGALLQVTDAGGTWEANLDAGMATDSELATHAGNILNPHAVTFEQLTPTTAKGDLLVESGTDVVPLPVGADGQMLMADSNTGNGVRWANRNPVARCFSNKFRFRRCAGGIITDGVSGLIWLRDQTCLGEMNWQDANTRAANLQHGQCGLSDGSRPGDWRLATKQEWEAILAPTCNLPPKIIGNNNMPVGGCMSGAPWGVGVESTFYWSSTTATNVNRAWGVALKLGTPFATSKTAVGRFWPVRGGQ